MKTACIALKQFLFAGVVLAVGQLFNTTKIHAGELQIRGLARLATAEELQEDQGIDDSLSADDKQVSEQQDVDNEKQELDDEQPADNEQPADDAGSDAGSSEEASAPVPKRRGRKQSS